MALLVEWEQFYCTVWKPGQMSKLHIHRDHFRQLSANILHWIRKPCTYHLCGSQISSVFVRSSRYHFLWPQAPQLPIRIWPPNNTVGFHTSKCGHYYSSHVITLSFTDPVKLMRMRISSTASCCLQHRQWWNWQETLFYSSYAFKLYHSVFPNIHRGTDCDPCWPKYVPLYHRGDLHN